RRLQAHVSRQVGKRPERRAKFSASVFAARVMHFDIGTPIGSDAGDVELEEPVLRFAPSHISPHMFGETSKRRISDADLDRPKFTRFSLVKSANALDSYLPLGSVVGTPRPPFEEDHPPPQNGSHVHNHTVHPIARCRWVHPK